MRIEEFFTTMPFVTKRLMYIIGALTALTTLQAIHPYSLLLLWEPIVHQWQVWRLVTNLFFWGPISIYFLMNFFIFLQYSMLMERNQFSENPADFIWCLLFGALVMTIPALMLRVPTLSGSLMMYLIYIWCNKNPQGHMSVMFIPYSIPAKWFPWALMGIRFLMSGSFADDLIGIVAGHLYFYLTDVLPREQQSNPLKTPAFLQRWFPVSLNARQFPGSGFSMSHPRQQQQQQQEQQQQQVRHRWGTGRRLGHTT